MDPAPVQRGLERDDNAIEVRAAKSRRRQRPFTLAAEACLAL
jgi:hypothetical protein